MRQIVKAIVDWRISVSPTVPYYPIWEKENSIRINLGVEFRILDQGKTLFETPWLGPFDITWDYSTKTAPFFGLVGLPVSASFEQVPGDKGMGAS